MIPQRFANSNIVMKAPRDMTDCSDIHAYSDGKQFITAWKPTPEELVKINLGEPVWLYTIGAAMPSSLRHGGLPIHRNGS